MRVIFPTFSRDINKWRARVKSRQKLVPQIRASFTKDARAWNARRYAMFTRGHNNHLLAPVMQWAVELICQNAWKTRQNETFSLWILLSPKPESFLMKVPRKMIFNHFFHFWPCQVPLWAVGAEKQPAERPPTEKPKVFQKYLRTWGEGRNYHIELGPSVCQWIQNINLIRLPEGPN